MDGTVLAHLLLILLVGFLSLNNITEATSKSKKWKEEASKQDIFPMCENVKEMCTGGVPDCISFSYFKEYEPSQPVVCCLKCKKGQKKLIPKHNDCRPSNPCGSHGRCERGINGKGYYCVCSERWSGQNCDIPIKYYNRTERKCRTQSCKMPNECVEENDLQDKIKTTLLKIGGHEHHVVVDTRKMTRLTKTIKETSSRGNGTVCFCSPGKRGLRCDLPCKAGTWGLYCLEKCDENCLKPECNLKDGECKCKRGYIIETGVCEPLPPTRDNCLKYCKHGDCNSNNNCACKYAQGFYCDTKCSDVEPYPRWGEQCENPCGGCTILPCERKNGRCREPKNPKAELCLDLVFFAGSRCDLSKGVLTEGTMSLINVDDLVPDDEFETVLARVANDQRKLNLIKENIRRKLKMGLKITLLPLLVGGLAVGGTLFGSLGGLVVLLAAGSIIGLHVLVDKVLKDSPVRKLLQHEEPGLRVDISLPLPPGGNASTYKNAMQKIMEYVADDFQTDLIPGLGAKKESIRVTSVQPFDNSDIEIGNSSTNSLSLVIGGVIVAIVAVVAALIALTLMKRKPSKNTPRVPVRQNNRKPSKNKPWGAPVHQNNLTFISRASRYTGPTASHISQQQFRQQIKKTSCTWA